jgi:hypothetical protein
MCLELQNEIAPPRASSNIALFFPAKSKKLISKFLLFAWMDVAGRPSGMFEAMTSNQSL